MDIKSVLSKVSKGEQLTDEEKQFLAGYDPDKVANSTAAAARKSAEAKLKEKEAAVQALQAEIDGIKADADEKANANKPEIERLSRELEKVKKQAADRETALQQLDKEKRKLVRGGKIARIMAGLTFVGNIDPDMPRLALETALAQVKDEDLDAADLVSPIVEKFKAANKAILADTSGHGSGNPPKDEGRGAGDKTLTMEKLKGMAPDEFLRNKDAIWKEEQKGTLK